MFLSLKEHFPSESEREPRHRRYVSVPAYEIGSSRVRAWVRPVSIKASDSSSRCSQGARRLLPVCMTEFDGTKDMGGEYAAGLMSARQGREEGADGLPKRRSTKKDLQPVRHSSRRIIKKKWADDELPEYEIDTNRDRHKVGC